MIRERTVSFIIERTGEWMKYASQPESPDPYDLDAREMWEDGYNRGYSKASSPRKMIFGIAVPLVLVILGFLMVLSTVQF